VTRTPEACQVTQRPRNGALLRKTVVVYRIRAVVPYDKTDPAVRERVFAWQTRLNPSVDYSIERGSPSHYWRRSSGADADIVCRGVSAWAQGFTEERVLRASKLGIYELDDALFLDDGRLPGLGRWWKPFVAKSRVAARSLGACDRVIAGNELIAEWAQRGCADVRIIPTCIEPTDYTEHRTSNELTQTESPPDLVWIGSAATASYLFQIAPSIKIAHETTGTRLVVIGSPTSKLPDDIVNFTRKVPWTQSITKEIGKLGGIGLMPLPDNRYEHHKCAYKLLQYAASSMVTIGSPYGASRQALKLFGGLDPRTQDEWTEALCSAVRMSAVERSRIGYSAKSAVTKHYSFSSWESEYRSAVGAPK
jgi:hypothetical protein